MKRISDDDKEFLCIIGALLFSIISFVACIYASTKVRKEPQAKYEETCITNYIKYPLKECTYKEVK